MLTPRNFLYLCVAVCAGVFFASFFKISANLLAVFAFLGFFCFFCGLLSRKQKVAVGGLILLFFIFGFWRFEYAWQKINDNGLVSLSKKNEEVEFTAIVVEDPQTSDSQQKLVVEADQWEGKILVTKSRYPEYGYGDSLAIKGKLNLPSQTESFDYKNYLAKNGIYSTINNPEIGFIEKARGNVLFSKIYWLKHKLSSSLYQNLPYPHNVLMAAILFGDQSRIPGCSKKEIEAAKEEGKTCVKLKEQFNFTGLRHLTAVSGMHVAIMASLFMAIALGLGFWRGQAFWITVSIVWLFILMIGFPASAVRAGIMGTLMLFAQKVGRPASSSRVVVIAATAMILQNPLLLRFDIGFQLSFLAVMGMIYLAPSFQRWLIFLPHAILDIRSVVAQTLAAQVFTLPLIIFNFGQVSLYSPLANLLIVPFVPLMTVLGFFLAGIGLTCHPLAWFTSLPCWFLLEYLLKVVEIISSFPFASLNFKISWTTLSVFYLVLALLVYKIKEHQKRHFLG